MRYDLIIYLFLFVLIKTCVISFRGRRRVYHKQSKLELVFRRRRVFRSRIYRCWRRTAVLRLLQKLMVHLCVLHNLRNDVSDYVDYCRVSLMFDH